MLFSAMQLFTMQSSKRHWLNPLYIASQDGHTDTVALLLKSNANPNLQKDNGTTPLYIASQNGHTNTVALLLKSQC